MMIKDIIQAVFSSAFGALFVTLPLFFIIGNIKANSEDNKLLEKAIKMGHVVTASLIDYHWDPSDQDKGPTTLAIYEYYWQGKRYKKRLTSSWQNPAREVTLYFLNNPRKAQTAEDLKTMAFPFFRVFIIAFVILLWINLN